MKKKIIFALLMAAVTTCAVSFTVIAINVGFISNFLYVWAKSWLIGYMVAIPLILFVAPKVQMLVDRIVKDELSLKGD